MSWSRTSGCLTNVALLQLLERRLRRNLCRAMLYFILFLFLLSPLASAQLELTTRLTPWPPEGWPAGAEGEVHAVAVADVTVEDYSEENLTTVFTFPVSETGEVTYRLPEELPRRARRFYQEASLDDFQLCPEVAPALSPPGARMVLLELALYADGQFWGIVDLTAEQGGLFDYELRTLLGLLYAPEPFRVAGSGFCAGEGSQVTTDLDLQAGLNLLEVSGSASLAGGEMLLTTTETLDLPQTPIGIGVGGGVSGGAP